MEILIFWDGDAPAGFQFPVSRELSKIFEIPVKIGANPLVVGGYTGTRRQTDAKVILDSLDTYKKRLGISQPILIVVSQDIFMEGTEFLFGLARPSTGSAIVSSARLDNTYYNLREDDEDLIDRLCKEGAHELGHLFGLDHCRETGCIMYNPVTLDDLDRKRREFCPGCREKLETRLEANPV